MTPILVTGPAIEPVSLAEAKAWLKVDTTADDDAIATLIASARGFVERLARRQLVTQTWKLALDAWPLGKSVELPLAPFRQVNAVRVIDGANVAQTISSALYIVDAAPEQARLIFPAGPPAPGREFAGIEIEIVVGYGDTAAAVPAPLRQAIKMLVADWYENRGDSPFDEAPAPVRALVAPFRRARLA